VEVVYCDNCGFQVAADALNAGIAARAHDGKIYCSKCAPLYKDTTTALQKLQTPSKTLGPDEPTGEFVPVRESVPAQSVMKFYFCETCGKRITDRQILEGLGRDKKLKGIYCKDCAVGVMTVEFAAIKEPQKLPAAAPTAPAAPARKASAIGIAPVERTRPGRPDTRIQLHETKAGKSPDRKIVALVAGIGAVVVLGLITLMSGSPRLENKTGNPVAARPPSSSKPGPAQPVVSDVVKAAPALKPVEPKIETALHEPKLEASTEKVPQPEQADKAKVAFDKLVKFEGLTDDDDAGRVQVIEAFLKEHSESSYALPARLLLDDLKSKIASNETKARVPPDPPPQAAKSVAPNESQQQLSQVLKELAPLLKRNQLNDAEQLIDDKLRDPGLAGISNRLKREKADLAEMRVLRQRAFDALRARNGATVALMMRGAKMTGVIKENPDRTGLSLAVRDGPEMAISAEQLEFQDVDGFAPAETGIARAEDLRRRVILFLAAGEMTKAGEYLTRAREAGLGDAELYLEKIAAFKQGEREAAALEAWKKAEVIFASKNWKAAKSAYEAFQKDFGVCSSFATNAETLKKRLQTINETLGLTLDLGGGIKLEMLLIPTGEFEVGSSDGEKNERPVHKVKISRPFYLGEFSVTQAQYEKIMGSNPSQTKGDNLPADRVTFIEAEEFCKRVHKLTGKAIRLPSEAEWEYACRAGTKTRFYTGDNDASLDPAAWFVANSEEKTHPVGLKKPNAWGLYDMHGNVLQWCQDWYADDYYEKSPTDDPSGPSRAKFRVVRGGSYRLDAKRCRSTFRNSCAADYHWFGIGFRVALAAP
jgi:formylglycine-generating enzyme required for sulfatase activity